MSLPRSFRRSPIAFFYLLIIVLTLALGYSRLLRRVSLADELRYVPRENLLLLATGDLDSVWSKTESLFREALYAPDESGAIATQVRDLKRKLAKKGIPLEKLADLRRYGIDTRRGVLFSAGDTGGEHVLVVPLRDTRAFQNFVEKASGELPAQKVLADTCSGESYQVAVFGDLLVAHPEPGLAVISRSEGLLRRSLFLRRENWHHALRDNVLFAAIRRVLRRPMMSGSTIFLFLRDGGRVFKDAGGLFRDAAIAIEIQPDHLRIRGDVQVAGGVLKAVDDLLRPSRSESEWRSSLPSSTAILLRVQSDALGRILRLLLDGDDSEDARETGLKNDLRKVSEIRQLVVGVKGYRQGLPEIVTGIWGDEAEFERLVFSLQKHLRVKRDRRLLEAALAEAYKYQCLSPSLTSEDLISLGLLRPEPILNRYPLSPRQEILSPSLFPPGEVLPFPQEVGEARLEPPDFRHPSY
ncbi:MAG TPA: hypothetical protein VF179_06985, partial [Thermoanaerobaculia bacterium]|nr:hypothetical protein [Thermoanaerobaculia bacterium]